MRESTITACIESPYRRVKERSRARHVTVLNAGDSEYRSAIIWNKDDLIK